MKFLQTALLALFLPLQPLPGAPPAPASMDAREGRWAPLEASIKRGLGLADLPVPGRASTSIRIYHAPALSVREESLTIWTSSVDGAIDLRYRAPFLVGWLRQLAVLCDPADPPSTSRALSLVRMVDCHMVLGSQDPMGIKGLCDRLTSRILAMRQGDSTGRARLPVVDGCGLRILLDTASGERDFKEVQDPEWDALVEKLCRILEAQGLKERLPDLEGFLGKDVIDLLGPDLLAEAASPADIELARTLIKLGVDVRRPSSRGACPLVEACGAGNLELVAMLLAAGADPNAGNHSEVWPESDLLPLDTAMNGALWGPGPHGAAIVRALIRSGADPNRSGSGYGSPLRRARKAKDAALIGILTAAGARE